MTDLAIANTRQTGEEEVENDDTCQVVKDHCQIRLVPDNSTHQIDPIVDILVWRLGDPKSKTWFQVGRTTSMKEIFDNVPYHKIQGATPTNSTFLLQPQVVDGHHPITLRPDDTPHSLQLRNNATIYIEVDHDEDMYLLEAAHRKIDQLERQQTEQAGWRAERDLILAELERILGDLQQVRQARDACDQRRRILDEMVAAYQSMVKEYESKEHDTAELLQAYKGKIIASDEWVAATRLRSAEMTATYQSIVQEYESKATTMAKLIASHEQKAGIANELLAEKDKLLRGYKNYLQILKMQLIGLASVVVVVVALGIAILIIFYSRNRTDIDNNHDDICIPELETSFEE